MKKEFGIGLLELMLSLAIIALLLVTATRYFSNVNTSRKVNEAVRMLQVVIGAVDQWQWTNKDVSDAKINKDTLVKLGMLPKRFEDDASNPWGGQLNIASYFAKTAKITLTNVPKKPCYALRKLMEEHKLEGSCKGGNFTAIYPSNLIHIQALPR